MTQHDLGVQWNVTILDYKTVVWIQDGDRQAVVSIADPERDEPARRVLADSTSQPLDRDENPGLTVYGTHAADRPSFAAFRLLAPEYAYLIDGMARGHGITQRDVTRG